MKKICPECRLYQFSCFCFLRLFFCENISASLRNEGNLPRFASQSSASAFLNVHFLKGCVPFFYMNYVRLKQIFDNSFDEDDSDANIDVDMAKISAGFKCIIGVDFEINADFIEENTFKKAWEEIKEISNKAIE